MKRNDMILGLFPAWSGEYAGYPNIVKKLIKDGECITTIQARDIDYGQMNGFIKVDDYNEGVDLIKVTLDLHGLYRSKVFKKLQQKILIELEDKILTYERDIVKMKDSIDIIGTYNY